MEEKNKKKMEEMEVKRLRKNELYNKRYKKKMEVKRLKEMKIERRNEL